jgi:hypothetical protein
MIRPKHRKSTEYAMLHLLGPFPSFKGLDRVSQASVLGLTLCQRPSLENRHSHATSSHSRSSTRSCRKGNAPPRSVECPRTHGEGTHNATANRRSHSRPPPHAPPHSDSSTASADLKCFDIGLTIPTGVRSCHFSKNVSRRCLS